MPPTLEQRLANEKRMHAEVEERLKADVDRVLALYNGERDDHLQTLARLAVLTRHASRITGAIGFGLSELETTTDDRAEDKAALVEIRAALVNHPREIT